MKSSSAPASMPSEEQLYNLYGPAFFGQIAQRVTDNLLASGGPSVLAFGITAPAKTMSILVRLRLAPASVTELAASLCVTHPAVIKNTQALSSLGLIESTIDETDRRRRPLQLTIEGEREAERVDAFMKIARSVYLDLFDEIGHDLYAGLRRMEEALSQESLGRRLNKAVAAQS